jgi:glycosyltransferase involved in cell wall biosynthesis
MPAYNAEAFVGQGIESLLAQGHRNWELLVADDGSTDRTRAIIDSYPDPRIRKLHNDGNIGQVLTKNRLLKASRGEFITFLDADDYVAPNRLERLVGAFQKDPSLGLCGSNVVRDFNGRLTYLAPIAGSWEEILAIGMPAFPAPAAVMVARRVYEAVGGYREFFNGMCFEDHDWIRRIVQRFPAMNLQDHLYFYRYNPESLGNRAFDTRKLAVGALVEHLARQRIGGRPDELERGDVESVKGYLNALLKKYDREEWKYYVELRRLTELRDPARFVQWLKMLLAGPLTPATWMALVRIVVPVGSGVDRRLIRIRAKISARLASPG